jgi:phosphohistidine phosphatase
MKIFLLRHCEAIEYKTETVDNDELRYITPGGRILTRKISKALKEYLKTLDRIFTSPLVRAVQCAEIVATVIKFKNEVELVNALRNESPTTSFQQLLKDNSSLNAILLVGHEPKLSKLVKFLSGKNDFTGFSKSGICMIDYDTEKETGKFEWYFDPKEMEFVN